MGKFNRNRMKDDIKKVGSSIRIVVGSVLRAVFSLTALAVVVFFVTVFCAGLLFHGTLMLMMGVSLPAAFFIYSLAGVLGGLLIGLVFRYRVRVSGGEGLVVTEGFRRALFEKDKARIRSFIKDIGNREWHPHHLYWVMIPGCILVALLLGPLSSVPAFLLFTIPLVYGVWILLASRYADEDDENSPES